jgi:hypothetical protein
MGCNAVADGCVIQKPQRPHVTSAQVPAATPSISVRPQNPPAIKPEELSGLVSELRSLFPDFEITEDYEDRARGYGVTWWEVVRLTVDQIPGAIMSVLIEEGLAAGIRWARHRFKSERGRYGPGRFRPKCVIIQDPDGTEFATAVVQSPRHKPISARELMDRTNNPKPKRRKKKAKQAKREKQHKKRRNKKKGR